MKSTTRVDYDSCLLGNGLLSQIFAHRLRQHGHRVLLIDKNDLGYATFGPPHLAITSKNKSLLERWGFSLPGSLAIDAVALYDGPTELLCRWQNNDAHPLGWHVDKSVFEKKVFEQTQKDFVFLKDEVLSLQHDGFCWQITTQTQQLSSLFCWDFIRLYSPMRYALNKQFLFLKLKCYDAHLFIGETHFCDEHTAYQFQIGSSLWAFLPLTNGRHYVVHTTNSQAESQQRPPFQGDFEHMRSMRGLPIAATKDPYHRFGGMLGSAAYIGHPNIAATFNTALKQLALLDSFLESGKEELFLSSAWNKDFNAQSAWLYSLSSGLMSSYRFFLKQAPQRMMASVIQSLS